MTNVLTEYNGTSIQFTEDGWFNATLAATKFGKEPYAWIRQKETVRYLIALAGRMGKTNSGFLEELKEISELDSTSSATQAKLLRLAKSTGLVKAKAGASDIGGGTWLHPKLAVRFAQWLDMDFAIWCDEQIDNLLRGKDDWKRARHEAASTHKVMCALLQLTRKEGGKETEAHHYANEARLVNWALTGEFKGIDRESLPKGELDVLAKLEAQNAVLIGHGVEYAARKPALDNLARVLHNRPLICT